MNEWSEIEVEEIRRVEMGNLKGFATLRVGPLVIRNFRVIQQPGQRPYVAMPQEKAQDGRFFPTITTDDRRVKEALQAAVLTKWAETDEIRRQML